MRFTVPTSQTFLGSIIRLPLRIVPRGMVVPVLSGPLRGRWWVVGSSNHGCWLGTYEREKQRLFARHIVEGHKVFYDIGAHVGFYSLLASVLLGPQGQVYAFEPLPANVRYLQKHLAINGAANVSVLELAVSDVAGVMAFEEGPSSSMGRISGEGRLQVKCARLDDLVEQKLVLPPDVLKIDVEGAELEVLRGAERTLAERKPIIFLATHGAEVHRRCCDYLRRQGFRLTPVLGTQLDGCDEILAIHGQRP